MKTVADRLSNPFGMRPPCERPCSDDVPAVFGFGDPNADFHLIGDHPGRHGGATSGIPFTDLPASERLLDALASVGLLEVADGRPTGGSTYLSYLHLCCPPPGAAPTEADYADLERFFDAELRAVTAHVLLPVGRRPTAHVLEQFSSHDLNGVRPETLHATELAGRGFLIVPIRDPDAWTDADEAALVETLAAVAASDYHQEADLTRFFPTEGRYLVR